MGRREIDPFQGFVDRATRVSDLIGKINPQDPSYFSIFEKYLKTDDPATASRNRQMIEAIKDTAALVGVLDSKMFGREIVKIARERGLVPKGTRRLPYGFFMELLSRGRKVREIIDSQPGTGEFSQTFSMELSRRRRWR